MSRSETDWVWRLSYDEQRRQVATWIARADGNIRVAAKSMGISRFHTYRLIHRLKLWPVVNTARLAATKERNALRHLRRATERRRR